MLPTTQRSEAPGARSPARWAPGGTEQRAHRLACSCSPSQLPGGRPRAPSQILALILLPARGRDTTSHLSHGDETVTILSSLERKHWTLASPPGAACLKIPHTQTMPTAEQSRRHWAGGSRGNPRLANTSRGCCHRHLWGVRGGGLHTG